MANDWEASWNAFCQGSNRKSASDANRAPTFDADPAPKLVANPVPKLVANPVPKLNANPAPTLDADPVRDADPDSAFLARMSSHSSGFSQQQYESHPASDSFSYGLAAEQLLRPEWASKINYTLAPGDKLVQCPYNLHHLVLVPKMAMHLWKCRRNYTKELEKKNQEVVYEKCHYNMYHEVVSKELAYHHEVCPDRESGSAYYRRKYNKLISLTQKLRIQEHEIKEQEEKRKKEEAAEFFDYANAPNKDNVDDEKEEEEKPKETNPFEEDWDEEIANNPYPGYDPREALRARNYRYFLPGGLTKSERKQFRKSVHELTGTTEGNDAPQLPLQGVASAAARSGPQEFLGPRKLHPVDEADLDDDDDGAGCYYVENEDYEDIDSYIYKPN